METLMAVDGGGLRQADVQRFMAARAAAGVRMAARNA